MSFLTDFEVTFGVHGSLNKREAVQMSRSTTGRGPEQTNYPRAMFLGRASPDGLFPFAIPKHFRPCSILQLRTSFFFRKWPAYDFFFYLTESAALMKVELGEARRCCRWSGTTSNLVKIIKALYKDINWHIKFVLRCIRI